MGATNTFAPWGIFAEGGAFFVSSACAVHTAPTTKRTRMLTTLLLSDIIAPSSFSFSPMKSLKLINHNLLDVFGACLSRALPATHRVGLVDGVAKNNRSRLQVGDLDAGLLGGVL